MTLFKDSPIFFKATEEVNILPQLGQTRSHNIIHEITRRSLPPVVYWRSNFSQGRGSHGHPERRAQCHIAESGAAATAQRGVWKEAGKRLILNVLEVLHVTQFSMWLSDTVLQHMRSDLLKKTEESEPTTSWVPIGNWW